MSKTMNDYTVTFTLDEFKIMLDQIRAEEREECAKVCEEEQFIEIEDETREPYNMGCRHSAKAIRARGEK